MLQDRPAADASAHRAAGVHVRRAGVCKAEHQEQAQDRELARRRAMGRGLQALELRSGCARHRGMDSSHKHQCRSLTTVLQVVYKRTPDLTREGGSIPVTLTFAESLGVNVLLLPMGRGDDGAQ